MTTTTIPAYMVYHQSGNDQPNRQFFAHKNLLTARRAAFTFVESFFNTRLEAYIQNDEAEVFLVEITTPDDPAPTVIAQIHVKPAHGMDAPAQHQASKHKLLELGQEHAYYLAHNHPIGFGTFGFTVIPPAYDPEPIKNVTVLHEAMGAAMVALALYGSGTDPHFTFTHWEPNEPINLRQLSK